MMYVTLEIALRVAFPLPRQTRIDMFKSCERFNEANDGTITMTFELRAANEDAVFDEAAKTVTSVKRMIKSSSDERAELYPVVFVRMQMKVRRGR